MGPKRKFQFRYNSRDCGGVMSKQIAVLLAIFVVLCALFVVVERTFSPSFQQCIAAAEENPSAFGVTVSYARCTVRILQSYEAVITAVATIVIAAFTGTLWWATSRQAQLTREAFIADKRAFVFASGLQPLYEPDTTTGHFN
jgi:hypothetical protein